MARSIRDFFPKGSIVGEPRGFWRAALMRGMNPAAASRLLRILRQSPTTNVTSSLAAR